MKKILYSILSVVVIMPCTTSLYGMNKQENYKTIMLLQRQESLQEEKLDEITTCMGAATIPLVMTTPKLYKPLYTTFNKIFTKKNAIIFGSVATLVGTPFVIKLLYKLYQSYQQAQIIINNPPRPSLALEINKLITTIKEKINRHDLANDTFDAILKKEHEFKVIYEAIEREKEEKFELSKAKVDTYLKTINDYRTTYLEVLSEHINSLLPPKKIEENNDHQNLNIENKNDDVVDLNIEIRKNNQDLKEMAFTFIKDIFEPHLINENIAPSSQALYKKSIEQLVSFIITELKPFEALEYPTQGLLKALKLDQLDELTQNKQICQRYFNVFLYLAIQNSLGAIETWLQNYFSSQLNDSVIELCQRFLKDAYAVTLQSDTTTLRDVFKTLEKTDLSVLAQNIHNLTKLVLCDRQQKLLVIPQELHPVKNDRAVYRYFFDKKSRDKNQDGTLDGHYFDDIYKSLYEKDVIFMRYFDLYKSLQEFVYMYDLCHKYAYELFDITVDEKKFYETCMQNQDKTTFTNKLIEIITIDKKCFIACTKSILPLLQQSNAPEEVIKELNDFSIMLSQKELKEI